ncbi:MAG: hypothetical protein R3E84_08090 [Pseudomonadales bacterium]|nr:hypothetical protein [Pseudomonadales bacterium]
MIARIVILVIAILPNLMPIAQAADAPPRDRVRLDETVISGNQELPKVLYILPWQDTTSRPALELRAELDQADIFRRLEPRAYRRELKYRNEIGQLDKKGQ